jgi:MoaA/NifB/PqqE/SkfB family radical SAM enzyme
VLALSELGSNLFTSMLESLVEAPLIVTDFPKLTILQLTYYCNLRCIHCCVDAGTGRGRELTTRQIMTVIDQLGELKIWIARW